MSPRPLRVLVTGGSGFIGSHLVERLLGQGHQVLCLDSFITGSKRNVRPFLSNPRLQLIEADVARSLPPMGRLDAIYNLACPASPRHYQRDPIHTMRTCVLGALNLLELARATGARILQASTSEIYGDPVLHPQPESYLGNVNPVGPRACYDEGKRAAETLFADYARRHGVKVRIARIFNTYGPRLRPEDGRVVSNFIVQALTGRPLTVFGAGHQTRSLCYIDDLVDGLLALMNGEVEPIEPINFGNPEERSVLTIARLVLELTGSSSPIEHRPLPVDDPQRRRPVIDRARAQLGWQPRVTIEDGLARTIDFFAAELGIGRRRSRALPGHARGSSPTDLIEIPLAG
jgi:UDP-glucuronate decarboxylase